jgi:uncharacterized membrane protein
MGEGKAVLGLKRWAKRWFIDAFGGMAQGLFSTLIIGVIIEQIGRLIGENEIGGTLRAAGIIAQRLMGAGIGAGIAYSLKADKLIVFSAAAAGIIGAFAGSAYGVGDNGFYGSTSIAGSVLSLRGPGNPIGAYLAAIISVETASLIAGKTKLDIILLPFTVIITAMLIAVLLCPPVIQAISTFGQFLKRTTDFHPFIMGIIISVVMGLLLTMPTSSAAMWVAIAASNPALSLAGGAAVAGCAAHMVGFAVASFRENGISGLISQGLGTSMLQIPNIMRKPVILLPAIAASLIVGPLSTCVFGLHCSYEGGGMGTSGLVGVFSTVTASLQNGLGAVRLTLGIALLFFIIPALVSFAVSEILRKAKVIEFGDMRI